MSSTIGVENISHTNGTNAITVSSGGDVTVVNGFTSKGIDDNATSTAITIDSSENVGIGAAPNNWGGMNQTLELIGSSDVQLAIHANSDSLSDGDRIGEVAFLAGTTNTLPNVAAIIGRVAGAAEAKGFLTFHCRDTDTGGAPQERMRINNSGDLLLGATTARTGTNTLSLEAGNSLIWFQKQNTDLQTQVVFNRNTQGTPSIAGTIQTTGTTVSYNTSSDYRLKENISYDFDATTRLKQLKPARFNWIQDETDTTVDGFLAHEVQSVVPEAISGTHNEVDDDDNPVYQGIDQSKLVPLLVKTIQELEARITALENGQ